MSKVFRVAHSIQKFFSCKDKGDLEEMNASKEKGYFRVSMGHH